MYLTYNPTLCPVDGMISGTDIRYFYQKASGILDSHAPPSVRKMANPVASAMHFEFTVMVREMVGDEYRVVNNSMTAVHNIIVRQQTKAVSEGGTFKLLDKSFLSTDVTTVEHTFAQFVKTYEKLVVRPSVFTRSDDALTVYYSLAAVDSPFFMPVTAAEYKKLSTTGKAAVNHATWTHARMREYWDDIARSLEPDSDESVLRMTLANAETGAIFSKDSTLDKMKNVLASVTDEAHAGSTGLPAIRCAVPRLSVHYDSTILNDKKEK